MGPALDTSLQVQTTGILLTHTVRPEQPPVLGFRSHPCNRERHCFPAVAAHLNEWEGGKHASITLGEFSSTCVCVCTHACMRAHADLSAESSESASPPNAAAEDTPQPSNHRPVTQSFFPPPGAACPMTITAQGASRKKDFRRETDPRTSEHTAAPWHVGSSRTGARTRVPCIGRRTLNHCATREAPECLLKALQLIPTCSQG